MAENSISYGMGLSDQQLNAMLNSDVPAIRQQAQDYINQAQTQQEQKPNILERIGNFFGMSSAGAAEPNNMTMPNAGTGFNTVLDQSGNLQYVPIEQPTGIMVPASETSQLDLVNQINQGQRNTDVPMNLEEIMAGSVVPSDPRRFPNSSPFLFPTSDIKPLNMNRFQGVSDMSIIDETTNDEQDQDYIDAVNENKENGIMKILRNLPTFGNLAARILPQEDPRATNMRNFYGNQYGLTSSGSIASGIMKGYNPVYGNDFLNKISGGIIPAGGYGLAGAMERRINNILGRKRAQTDASRAKIAELRNLQLADMTERANKGESLASIGKSTFSGPGMAFEAGNTNQGGGVTGGQVKDMGGVPGGKYGSPR